MKRIYDFASFSTGENCSATGEFVVTFCYFQLATGTFIATGNWQLAKLWCNWYFYVQLATCNLQLATSKLEIHHQGYQFDQKVDYEKFFHVC